MTNKTEILNLIPASLGKLKNFLETVTIVYHTVEDEIVKIDFELYGCQFLLEINPKEEILTFCDDLVTFDAASNYIYGLNNSKLDPIEWKNAYSKLMEDVEKLKIKLVNTGYGNEDYLWYEFRIPRDEFNPETFKKAAKLWSDYNSSRRKIYGEN